jgi:O-antigen/teichoic acid export membrane protein
MGLALGLQWCSVLSQAGLTGLQKQVSQGVLNIVLWAMRYLGVIPVLWHWPTVQAYFIWNAIVSGLHTAALGLWLWKVLPPAPHRAVFQWPLLKSIRYFAAGNTGIQLSSTALSQLDKIVVGRLLSLEWMGYYGLASQACVGLLRLVYSLQPTFFPRYTQLIADNRWEDLTSLYHRSCQLMAVVTFSIMAVVVLFSHEIILLWTGQAAVADHAWLIMSLLIVGTALSSLTMLPSSLQLAYGWTKLSAAANFISLVVLVPAMIVLARRYGAVGAAAAWIIPYAVQVFVFIPLMHRRLLPGELWRWYLRDNAAPLLAAAVAATALRLLAPSNGSPAVLLVGVLAAGGAALLASSLATPVTRAWLAGILNVARASRP